MKKHFEPIKIDFEITRYNVRQSIDNELYLVEIWKDAGPNWNWGLHIVRDGNSKEASFYTKGKANDAEDGKARVLELINEFVTKARKKRK